jgi:hypothetical protein
MEFMPEKSMEVASRHGTDSPKARYILSGLGVGPKTGI